MRDSGRSQKPSAAAAQTFRSVTRAPRGAWLPAFASALLLWAAFPPLDLWPLAWIAPLGWLWLCGQNPLPGRRPWLALWLSGFAFWLGVLHFLRLPHPATSLGWLAISFYFAFYTPAFVWLTRRAIEHWHVPLVLAAPIAWTGLELLRGHLLTGLTYGALGYTQFRWIALIQVADLAAVYGVSFIVMLGAAAIATALFTTNNTARIFAPVAALLLVTATLAYGYWRIADRGLVRTGPKVALIQGSIDTELKADPNKRFFVHDQYLRLSEQALHENPDLDLIVWPETMFRESLMTFDPDFRPPTDVDWTADDARYSAQLRQEFLAGTARHLRVPAIIGIDCHHYGPGTIRHYNAAIHIEPTGAIKGRYEKIHRVMFGEYIPFGDWFPWLYKITPVAASLTAGEAPRSFAIGSYRLAPNICFENILPHFVRWQVRTLRQQGEEPDFLVNLTNDGWFWGSSELDQHLTCAVFRAVEMRKPFLIAANTGFSASIDADGRIQAQGPRRDTDVVIARVTLDDRRSPYARWGDWFAGLCLAVCGAIATAAVVEYLRKRRSRFSPPATA
jgi:apolipoprotein N-acyltransferase